MFEKVARFMAVACQNHENDDEYGTGFERYGDLGGGSGGGYNFFVCVGTGVDRLEYNQAALALVSRHP